MMLYPNAPVDFPRLSSSDERHLILSDIYGNDVESMDNAIQELCDDEGIAFCWSENGEEIDNLIIEKESYLENMYAVKVGKVN